MLSTPQRRLAAWALIGALATGLLLFSLTTFYKMSAVVTTMRHAQVESTERGKEIKSLTETINGCVDPEGECYKQGQRRTAAAVGDINRVVILAAACSVGLSSDLSVVERQAEIQGCVLDRLARSAATQTD